MTLDSNNVRVAVTGVVACGPTTADAPTSPSSALDADIVDLGYVGESGVTESRKRSTNQIKAWQRGATVRTVVTDATYTLKFVLIESKKVVLETFYGTVTQGATADYGRLDIDPAATGGRKTWVVDVIDDDEVKRIYIEEGEITEVGDVVYAAGQEIGHEVTVTGYDVGGHSAVIWSTALKTAA